MTIEQLIVLAVVAVFSVIQSFFGMGILVFGTPSFLLMGYDFLTTLGFLLPASFTIALLQVLTAGSSRVPISRYLYIVCLPGIGIGLLLTGNSWIGPFINFLVGITLLLSALVRFWLPSQRMLTFLLCQHLPAYHLIMGIVHGLTNLGGALLAILASVRNNEKEAIRYTVAHYYLAFCSIQMLLLGTIMGHYNMLISNFPTAMIAAAVYFLLGNRIFSYSSNQFYSVAMNLFIAAYGVVILLMLEF